MRVFIAPTGLFSPAMVRIARALGWHAPDGVEVVTRTPFDVAVLYVIGKSQMEECEQLHFRGTRYAVVQCCLKTAGGTLREWLDRCWSNAALVWSYYDIQEEMRVNGLPLLSNFYHAPLGVDHRSFYYGGSPAVSQRDVVLTTGHVHGWPAEEVLAPWAAAKRLKMRGLHVGPWRVEGFDGQYPAGWCATGAGALADTALAAAYRSAAAVCALRYVEGFELPAAEALCCGTRPVVFDQPATRHWYEDMAEYVDERLEGVALVDAVEAALRRALERPVTLAEADYAARRFYWRTVADEFWRRLGRPAV